MSQATDVRPVIFHAPGPDWDHEKEFRAQPGIDRHVAHYGAWREAGKLAWGGPFLAPDAGGMMVPVAGLESAEVAAYAAADPAVKSGLLAFAIRPWLVVFNGPAL